MIHETTSLTSTVSSFPIISRAVKPQYAPFILKCSITTDSKLSFFWKIIKLFANNSSMAKNYE
jgi:hypothetical protein